MRAFVFKSLRRPDTYVWLAGGDLAVLPDTLVAVLGELQSVLEVELTPERSLPGADAREVLASLQSQGFYMQLPRGQVLDPLTTDHGTDA